MVLTLHADACMHTVPGWSLQVVAFVKGTRQSPQCGFSYKMLTLLNDSRAEYEVGVNCWCTCSVN